MWTSRSLRYRFCEPNLGMPFHSHELNSFGFVQDSGTIQISTTLPGEPALAASRCPRTRKDLGQAMPKQSEAIPHEHPGSETCRFSERSRRNPMGSWEDFADGPLDPEVKRKILALARQGEAPLAYRAQVLPPKRIKSAIF